MQITFQLSMQGWEEINCHSGKGCLQAASYLQCPWLRQMPSTPHARWAACLCGCCSRWPLLLSLLLPPESPWLWAKHL